MDSKDEPAVQKMSDSAMDVPDFFHTIAFYSLLCGLTPFIPVPFLDDWVGERIQRVMVSQLLKRKALDAQSDQIALLLEGPADKWGCIGWLVCLPILAIKGVLRFIVGKIIKTLLFVLIINECSDRMSEAFHNGYLVQHALDNDLLTEDQLDDEHLILLHQQIVRTCEETDTRLLRKALAKVLSEHKAALRKAGRALARMANAIKRKLQKGQGDDTGLPGQNDSAFQGIVSSLERVLWGMQDYLKEVTDRFDKIRQEEDESLTS